MPDIFVNSDPSKDIGHNQVAEDPIEIMPQDSTNQQTSMAQDTNLQPDTAMTNAQKHAAIRDNKENLPGHTHNTFASFFYYPEKVDFVDKDSEEVVILLVRRHPITNVPWIAMTFLMIISPAFVSVLPFLESIPSNFQT